MCTWVHVFVCVHALLSVLFGPPHQHCLVPGALHYADCSCGSLHCSLHHVDSFCGSLHCALHRVDSVSGSLQVVLFVMLTVAVVLSIMLLLQFALLKTVRHCG